MKKIVLSLFMLLSWSMLTQAQVEKKFYVNLRGGYALAMSNDNRSYLGLGVSNYNAEEISAGKYDLSIPKIGFGKGFQTGFSVGYIFNKYLGTELSADYLMGGNSTITYQALNGERDVTTLHSKSYFAKPAIVFHAGFTKMNPYVKLGFILGKSSLFKEVETINSHGTPNENYSTAVEFKGGTSFGYKGTMGMSYQISSKFYVFGELDFNKISYTPNKSIITKYMINGVDTLGSLTVYQSQTEYPTSYTSQTGVPDPNLPNKQPRFQTDLSSMALSFGVNYVF